LFADPDRKIAEGFGLTHSQYLVEIGKDGKGAEACPG
jgi:hypothetical protein